MEVRRPEFGIRRPKVVDFRLCLHGSAAEGAAEGGPLSSLKSSFGRRRLPPKVTDFWLPKVASEGCFLSLASFGIFKSIFSNLFLHT